MLDRIFFVFLALTPLALIAELAHVSPLLVFFLAAVAIIPLAKYVGEATEVLASRSGPALGGFLNATFGNAAELIIGIFALRAGLLEVVKASLAGSIFGNLLLVTGMAMFVGGLRHKKQEFNRTAAMASSSTLLLAVIALVMPAFLALTAPSVGTKTIQHLSTAVSGLMIAVYIASLWFVFYTHKHLYTEEVGRYASKWSTRKGIAVLALSTVALAWLSEILVGAIEPVVEVLGWTQLFIGVVVVAIVGNVAEHSSAVVMAAKNRMDLALQVAIGSATQIAMFVAPLLVFISLALSRPFSLVFTTFELIAIVFSVFITNLVVEDGESNWLEGLQLLAAYVIIATAFFYHP